MSKRDRRYQGHDVAVVAESRSDQIRPRRESKLTLEEVQPGVVDFFEDWQRQRTEVRSAYIPPQTVAWNKHRRRVKEARKRKIKVYQGGAPGLGKRA